ncbi:helix-turn-helix domain-containing protein [Streptomyces sp. CC53]|uniref:helix-turn-helix domain-containing protein n=1 Tax=Streptomyces sp. CC53 TaxID=1906740 RepID=UPI00210E2AED|nr:helix-turn-helix transcriptional regulator [Streptomyces sp. CC53]
MGTDVVRFSIKREAVPARLTPLPDWVIDRRRQLGHRIAEHRRAAGLSQDQLASRIGVERRSIQRYERGERDIAYTAVVLIADALDVPVADLVR